MKNLLLLQTFPTLLEKWDRCLYSDLIPPKTAVQVFVNFVPLPGRLILSASSRYLRDPLQEFLILDG